MYYLSKRFPPYLAHNLGNPLGDLKKSSSFLITGKDQVNSPFTNPWIDQAGKVGKNLFDAYGLIGKANNANIFRTVVDGREVLAITGGAGVNGYVIKNDFKPNTQYTLKADSRRLAANGGVFVLEYTDGDVQYLINPTDTIWTSRTFTTAVGKTVKELRLSFGSNGATNYFDINTFMLNEGSSPLTYEPYGKANVILQGFAGTTSDGWVVETAPGTSRNTLLNQAVVNGDFANGTTGWTSASSTLSASSKILSSTGNGTNASVVLTNTAVGVPTRNSKYFVKAKIRVTNSLCSTLRFRISDGVTTYETATINTPVANQWYDFIGVITVASVSPTLFRVQPIHTYADAATANGKVMEVDGNVGVFAIPITGTPYENYSADTINMLISKDGYFEGNRLCLDGKQVVGCKADALDSVGIMGANAPNPVGTQDFGFAFVFKTGAIVGTGNLIARSTNSDRQYMIRTESNGLTMSLNGTLFIGVTGGTLIPNTFYKLIFKRVGGQVVVLLNNISYYNQSNPTSIIERAFCRLFARSTDANGLSHTEFFNGTIFLAAYNNGVNMTKWEADVNKFVASQYGL